MHVYICVLPYIFPLCVDRFVISDLMSRFGEMFFASIVYRIELRKGQSALCMCFKPSISQFNRTATVSSVSFFLGKLLYSIESIQFALYKMHQILIEMSLWPLIRIGKNTQESRLVIRCAKKQQNELKKSGTENFNFKSRARKKRERERSDTKHRCSVWILFGASYSALKQNKHSLNDCVIVFESETFGQLNFHLKSYNIYCTIFYNKNQVRNQKKQLIFAGAIMKR